MGKRLESHPFHTIASIRKLAIIGHDFQPWYDDAIHDIQSVCQLEEWDHEAFVDRLAILSPRISVRRNVRAAYAYAGQGKLFLGGVVKSIKQAMANYNTTGIVGGRKVSQFALALHGVQDAITLDTWMATAMLATGEPSILQFRRVATRAEAYRIVRKIAKQLGVSPRDCQAMVWAGCFRSKGLTPIGLPIIEEYDRWIAYDRSFPQFGVIGIPADDDILAPIDDTNFEFGNNQF